MPSKTKVIATLSHSELQFWLVVRKGEETQCATICDKGVEKILGLDQGNDYKIVLLNKKPKKWRTSFWLSAEPTADGNNLYLSKRRQDWCLGTELARLFFDAFYFNNKPIKIWVQLKKIKE